MKIILVRHGQTEWNLLGKYQGHTDISLNETGRGQALRAAEYLAEEEKVEAIYCSDLKRTRETADIIAGKLNLPVTCDPRLRELSFGLWEGLTFNEVYERYPQDFDHWFNNTCEMNVPQGESFNQLKSRAVKAVEEISQKHKGTVVVVTHGGTIKALLHYINNDNCLWKTVVEPGSLTYLAIEENNMKVLRKGVKL